MSAEKYTQEQIFSGLRMIWRDALDFRTPLHLDMNFMAEFKAGGAIDEIDIFDVFYRIQREFGFTCAWEEWKAFLSLPTVDEDKWNREVAPRLTFRALAVFIRERLEPISLEPITLLGKPCRTAGIFRALERLAGQVHPAVKPFGPSTPIRARLKGFRLCRYWSRLRWIVEDQLPPPPQITFPIWRFLNHLFVKLGIGSLIALCRRDLGGLLEALAVTLLLFLPVGMVAAWINAQLNPLPKGIETFGDLARVLAAILVDQQSEAASCSTP